METFLERYVLPYKGKKTRLDLLSLSVINDGVLGFDYEFERTLTAGEAFSRRSGNCIAFANMFIAMARRAGLTAHYQQVTIHPEWFSKDETLLVANHINVIVKVPGQTFVIDPSGREFSNRAQRRILPDVEAKSLYYENLGVEALLSHDLPTAYAMTAKAIETSPKNVGSWSNLGVILARNDQPKEAEQAYLRAIEISSRAYSAMSNLYGLYQDQENLEGQKRMETRVERYRRQNPYYLVMLSDEAVAESRFEDSTELLKNAIKKKEDDHRLYFALAKTQYLSGETRAAENSMIRARELAPEDVLANYHKPLHVLIAEERAADESDQ
jgi:Flp pilus assembly protein TadD